MIVFLDTSALFAVLDADDRFHTAAAREWQELLVADERLVTSNYVLVETYALVGRRLGLEALRALTRDVLPALQVEWVGPALHERAVAALVTAGDVNLSLVDCTSFEVMRDLGLEAAFAFDDDFAKQGFRLMPS